VWEFFLPRGCLKTANHLAVALGTAFAAAVGTLLFSYFGLRWLLISYHESQIGHKNPFTVWADVRAITMALLASLLVFSAVLVFMNRRKHSVGKH
jgi:hypothetical protein